MNYPYSLIIQWSNEDNLYLVTLPDFATIAMQPCTHGKTYQDAIENAQDAIESYLAYCQDENIPIPQPQQLQAA
jgi:antitoxin HicB